MQRERPDCPCVKRRCPRRGDCERCREHHRLHPKYPPYCERKERPAAPKPAGDKGD